jgi:hypothetical protein
MTEGFDRLFKALAEADGESAISLPDYANATFREWGGAEGFAKAAKQAYDDAESEAVKARIFALNQELVIANAKHGQEATVGRLSDEDLKEGIVAALPALIEEMARGSFGDGYAEATVGAFLSKARGA